jgi:hypothetical protein
MRNGGQPRQHRLHHDRPDILPNFLDIDPIFLHLSKKLGKWPFVPLRVFST